MAKPGRTHQRELREWIGISLQETRLSEKLTVRETLNLFASFYRQPTSVDAVLEELSLQEKGRTALGRQAFRRPKNSGWPWRSRSSPIRKFFFSMS